MTLGRAAVSRCIVPSDGFNGGVFLLFQMSSGTDHWIVVDLTVLDGLREFLSLTVMTINTPSLGSLGVYILSSLTGITLLAPSVESVAVVVSPFCLLSRLVMSSSVGSSHSVDSSLTRTASGSASQSSDDPTYDWVDPSVLNILTKIRTSDDLDKFFSANKDFIESDCPIEALAVDVCGITDRVCHSRENAPHDFFFVYSTLFANLHVTFPFDNFTMGVLRILNVRPTQLHPNSWAILQAFRILYRIFKLTPTPESFLYYYNTHPSTPVSWLSLSSRPGNVRFVAYTTSYKNFKENYFKVFVEPDDRDLFYNADGTTKFPFH